MAPTFPVEFAGQRVSKNLSQTNFTRMMGKTRKVSKGYSYGFVPDYRHAVETMADSEGFGSSGRLDTEMTASEDSCAPRRKCINLNGDSYQQLGVPIQVLSLSKLSGFERKELGFRLKRELEQVRTFQKNIAMVSSNGLSLSPSSDVHSCSAGQRRPIPEFSRSMSVPASHCKKKAPPGRNGGARSKKSAAGRVDSVKKALPPASGNAMLMKQCETLLNRLMSHNFGWVFNTPVDVVELNIPDYYTVIKHPMDLGTVKTKLTSGRYMDQWAFAADVRLTFSNAMTYNPRGNDVHLMAETLSKFFEVRWKAIEKKLLVATEAVVPMRQNVVETETATPMPPFKKKKTTYLGNEIKQEPVKRTMSDTEKHKLSSELESSLSDLPESIIDFLKDNSSNGNQTTEDEIEIDIDTLSNDTLFKLRKLLDDYLVDKQKNMAKAETCEIELHNESGFSNSSMQACKANDANEEDVDIGGNDLPISSFPPIEIEKDTAVRNSKCSSSSSSSSDSGSSSSGLKPTRMHGHDSWYRFGCMALQIVVGAWFSEDSELDNVEIRNKVACNVLKLNQFLMRCAEIVQFFSIFLQIYSDSDSSSGSESDGANASAIMNNNKVSSLCHSSQLNSVNGMGLVEQKSHSIPVSGEVDGRQEGESAASERQGCEKQDRERLRLEKEELEKRRKEEKARLQAEAKAAEEARRNAELEAAIWIKIVISNTYSFSCQMEKMVDIDDNSGFLEDLEMLSVAAAEPLENFIDEASADCGEGRFKLNGKGNPLEQLGLYMKDDEDEEEEEVNPRPAQGGDDPEEGEID
ncbi:Bromodomain-containing protein [Cynara cardunculus var. scolymus]|uniref:Bromodomain-containing protein n=1 Tax=Cynara cardunculus var. scolymus TaxID=59895 RepID=A0A103XWF2_CYNCS|nr:Bromodomain-containing protein [Cynara cardunculus var. scolymus]